jgi:ribosomal protein S18 acetylase RimI-like enzyme
MKASLRPYQKSDWPALLALWIEAWTHTRSDIDFAARAPWLADLLAKSEQDGAEIVVAEDGTGLAGFVLFDADRQWLEQIAVHPRAQGDGVARRLVRRVKAACPERVDLTVNMDNKRALAFYHSEGFVRQGKSVNALSGLPIYLLRWEREQFSGETPDAKAAGFREPPAPQPPC